MKLLFLALAILSFTSLHSQISIIPQPVEIKPGIGSYHLKNKITVSSNFPEAEWNKIFTYFQSEMKKRINTDVIEERNNPSSAAIRFEMQQMPTPGKPAYRIKITQQGIIITSNFTEPAFHALQTFFQLLPAGANAKMIIPAVSIFDYSRFNYRGMHLDVSRHFFPVSFIKRYIDWLAFHKMNYFHWHLTDDQGWRIEIKRYPLLIQTGSKRNGTIIGRYPGKGNDNIPYGGYYTQDNIREIVKYAQERFITIIPEIEMPGHSSAAIASYSWLSCFPEKLTAIPPNMISKKSVAEQKTGRIKLVQETWGVFDDVFCAGKDSTFQFLENVLDEIISLFPSNYIHIGGDESPKVHWKICQNCQQRIKELRLKDEHELQGYFTKRIGKYLYDRGKIIIGWDEILEGGLAPNAIVMSWQGIEGGIAASKQGHNVIMTPQKPVYFDHSQSRNEDSVTIGGYNPLEEVYGFEPIPQELKDDERKLVLGAQSNLWTEYITNPRKVEYMIFPRIAALSEILWSPADKKDYVLFEKRLETQLRRYDAMNIHYSKAFYELKGIVVPSPDYQGVQWKLETKRKDGFIGYPYQLTGKIEKYSTPIQVKTSGTKQACYYQYGRPLSCIKQNFSMNLATGKKNTLEGEPSYKYPGDGAFTLVNGVINEKGFAKSNEFLGFSGTDCITTIDLQESTPVSFVVVNALTLTGSWIWRPLTAEVFSSTDGKEWHSLKLTDDFNEKPNGEGKGFMTLSFRRTYVRYLKVVIKNWGEIPAGNPGAGNKAWLFVDEIEVQ